MIAVLQECRPAMNLRRNPAEAGRRGWESPLIYPAELRLRHLKMTVIGPWRPCEPRKENDASRRSHPMCPRTRSCHVRTVNTRFFPLALPDLVLGAGVSTSEGDEMRDLLTKSLGKEAVKHLRFGEQERKEGGVATSVHQQLRGSHASLALPTHSSLQESEARERFYEARSSASRLSQSRSNLDASGHDEPRGPYTSRSSFAAEQEDEGSRSAIGQVDEAAAALSSPYGRRTESDEPVLDGSSRSPPPASPDKRRHGAVAWEIPLDDAGDYGQGSSRTEEETSVRGSRNRDG